MVEFAICMPIFLALSLGICELGQGFKAGAILSEAARSGCATACQPGYANSDAIAEALEVLSVNKYPTSSATVTILVNDVVGNVATAKLNDKITVTVSIPANKVIWTNTFTYLTSGSILTQRIIMMKQG